MRLRAMLLLVAILPLVLAIAAVVGAVGARLQALAATQKEQVVGLMDQARRQELQRLVQAGVRAVQAKVGQGGKDLSRQREALDYLRELRFGDDNYFFVYALDGRILLDAGLRTTDAPTLDGHEDSGGMPLQVRLAGVALGRGGFLEFDWLRPSTARPERKLVYVELVPQWEWVVGTGVYRDELRVGDEAIGSATEKAVVDTRDLILLIATLALLAVGAGGLMLNLYEQRKADVKLRRMARQVVQSQEVERTRVARELHDGVSQSLAGLKFGLESALVHVERGSQATAELLRGGLAQLRSVMRDVRRISHDLRPTMLDDLGLAAALAQTAREFAERTGVAVEPRIEALPGLPDAVATTVFRVTQEALANVERHAQASQVVLALAMGRQGLTLTVSDNGQGFDVAAVMQRPREGLGLSNMRERIETLGGQFGLRSAPGATVLTATLPAQALRQ